MKETDPFEDFKIAGNQKGFFQYASHEAKELPQEQKIAILIQFIQAGYCIYKVVEDYIISLDGELKGQDRISHVISTLDSYTIFLIPEDGVDFERSRNLKEAAGNFELWVKKTILTSYYLKELNLVNDSHDSKVYDKIKPFWTIEFKRNLKVSLLDRTQLEGLGMGWNYASLFNYFKNSVLADLKSNRILYMELGCYGGFTPIVNAFIKKFYPKEDHVMLSDPDIRRERILELATRLVGILYFGEPLFNDPTYLFRCNYKEDNLQKHIPYLFKKSIVSICIQDVETKDQECYDAIIAGEKPAKKFSYISRFLTLAQLVKEEDVIVIATYTGHKTKMGLLKKGSEILIQKFDEITLYCFTLESVYATRGYENFTAIDLNQFPVLNNAMPITGTISPLLKAKDAIYQAYYGLNEVTG